MLGLTFLFVVGVVVKNCLLSAIKFIQHLIQQNREEDLKEIEKVGDQKAYNLEKEGDDFYFEIHNWKQTIL